MVRRETELRALGGAWAFPGGVVDDADADLAARVPAHERERCEGRIASPPAAGSVALHVAACRETFEECGVLLARAADGSPCAPERAARAAARGATFAEALADGGLHPDVGALVAWSRWITPALVPVRFDARFFVAAMPDGQVVRPSPSEVSEVGWFEPGAPLDLSPPPSRLTLADIGASYARHGSVVALLEGEAERPLPPIMPRVVEEDGERVALMPWHPGYGSAPGPGIELEGVGPPHLLALPDRLTVQGRLRYRD